MSDIRVNKLIWDSLQETDRQHIAAHLREYGVLKPDHKIAADAHAPLPEIRPHVISDTGTKADVNVRALGVDWIRRAICDSTHAETDCSVYGQSLKVCLSLIAASRKSCKP